MYRQFLLSQYTNAFYNANGRWPRIDQQGQRIRIDGGPAQHIDTLRQLTANLHWRRTGDTNKPCSNC